MIISSKFYAIVQRKGELVGHEPGRSLRLEPVRSSRRRLLTEILALPAALACFPLGERLFNGGVASGKKKASRKRGRNDRPGSRSATAYSPEPEELAFLDLLNTYRAEHGAGRLSLQNQLGAAAENHSQDMAENDFVSHRLSNGDSPLKNIERFGYDNFTWWGEILAAGTSFETAQAAISALKTSPSHDAMMRKNAFNQCGIGRANNPDARHQWYWTVTFGQK